MVEVLVEFTSALRKESSAELEEHFSISFPHHKNVRREYGEMVVQSPIRVYSLCSHHMLPIIYDIAFAYIPRKGRLIGLSKIARALSNIAKRPMNQEDFTQEAVEIFNDKIRPTGLAIVVSGTHLCIKMRGVRCETTTKTFAVKGNFNGYERAKDDFMTLANNFNYPL